MDDATKAYAKPLSWSDSDRFYDQTDASPNLDSPTVPEPGTGKSESTDESCENLAGTPNT